jgi:GAF domain-containing protein
MEQTRQTLLLETLVTLADTLVAGYDVVDLLQSLVDSTRTLAGATATGILLSNDHDQLEVVAASDENANTIELLQQATGVGPCIECFRTGETVSMPDIAEDDTWPAFREACLRLEFRSLLAVPLRLRDTTIGSLNLLRSDAGAFGDEDTQVAVTLADMATIGILHERAVRESSVARQQLQRALDSRVVIEQAKGVVAQQRDISMGAAFDLIRGYARSNRLGLGAVAELIVERRLKL